MNDFTSMIFIHITPLTSHIKTFGEKIFRLLMPINFSMCQNGSERKSQWLLERWHGNHRQFVFTKIGPGGLRNAQGVLRSADLHMHHYRDSTESQFWDSLIVGKVHILFPVIESCSCSWIISAFFKSSDGFAATPKIVSRRPLWYSNTPHTGFCAHLFLHISRIFQVIPFCFYPADWALELVYTRRCRWAVKWPSTDSGN